MRIALIEDNEPLAKGIAYQLRDAGHAVDLIGDGATADTFLAQEGADLIILDIALPKLSGFEICRKIRRLQNDKDVVIFVLVAKKKDKTKIEDHGMGVQKYFLKSVSATQLVNEVHEFLLMSENDQASQN